MLGIGLVAGILALGNATMVSAQPLSIMDEVETSADYAEDTSYSLLRGNHLNLGTVKAVSYTHLMCRCQNLRSYLFEGYS